jgi:diguanylate cyclase (GGDEF)-like protein
MKGNPYLRRVVQFIALILLTAGAASAQRYSFRTYQESEGLTDLNVTSVFQDHNGFIWAATTSGVFRFDGRHFRQYGMPEGLPASLALRLMETGNDEIWVDTPAGVARLEGDRFVAVDTGGHHPSRCPQGMARDRTREYIATSTGLFWRSESGGSGIVPGTEGLAVWSVLAAGNAPGEDADLWYSLDRSVCARHNDVTHCYSLKDNALPEDRWGGIAVDPAGTLWLRSSRRMVVLPRGATKFESRDTGLAITTHTGDMSLDSRGMPLVSTQTGLARWNGSDAPGNPWTLIGSSAGLAVAAVGAAIEDREGSIWVGMRGGGLARWLGAGEWESWTSEQGLGDDLITAIGRDRKGRLLIGTGSGLNVLDGGKVGKIPIGALGAAGNGVVGIAQGEGNDVWLGTPGGVGLLDTRTGHIRKFDAASGLTIEKITALIVDHLGVVWAGGYGLYRGTKRTGVTGADPVTWEEIAIPPPHGSTDSYDSAASIEDIYGLAEDRDGRIWFGGTRGLGYWDGRKVVRLGTAQGVPARTVSTVYGAADGSVWFGMYDSADVFHIVLSRDRNNSPTFAVMPFRGPASAAGCGPVFVAGVDTAGNVWRSGAAGLDAYIQGRWIPYTRADGLAWNTSSRNAFFADTDGSVWIGTSHGLSHHRSVTAQNETRPSGSRATIVGLQAGGRSFNVTGIPRIDYHAGNFAISFASPVFRHDKDVRFRYRLSGLETAWTKTAEWDARYSGLKPGRYTFEVESGDWDGHWSGYVTRLPFEVTGPFWTSPWFTPGWIGSLALLALVVWRVRDRAHAQREYHLREAVAGRTRELELERQRERSRNKILENLVSNEGIGLLLDGIAKLLSDQIATGAAVIMVRRPDGWHAGAASGCPAEWLAALETPGTVPIEICAEPWLCQSPADEPAWSGFMANAGHTLPSGIASTPIGGPDGAVGAVLFLYSATPGSEPWAEIFASAARIAQVVIEHRRFYDDLRFQAHHDSLTGLHNRSSFGERLSQAFANAHSPGKRLALLYIDIDRFKEINDRLSHRAGDIVLSTLATRMNSVLRPGDTLARIGGDEFNILLDDLAGDEDAADIGAAVLAAIREPVLIGDIPLNVSASIGIAIFPDDAANPEELQRQADAAMYSAKNLGKNRVQAFSDRDRALDTQHIEQALRHGLRDGLFTVYYQPKVAAGGTFAGFEALLRLKHPKMGDVPPDLFIPVAEEKGLIVPIGEWVFEEVCRQIAEWRDRGFGEIPVAINVSPIQISRPDFAEWAAVCLARQNVSPTCVELELTESQALNGAEEAGVQMKALRKTGIRFSIDDFGTGYSSLSYLHRLQVDAIKLDRSFVQSIDTDEGARQLVRAMLGVAQALGLNVIAEGVETEEQRAALVAAGCPFMQGYFFSRPQPAARFDQLLANYAASNFAGPNYAVSNSDLRRLCAALEPDPQLAAV